MHSFAKRKPQKKTGIPVEIQNGIAYKYSAGATSHRIRSKEVGRWLPNKFVRC